MKYVLAFLVPFIAVLIIVPILNKLAVRFDFLDKPTERKDHKSATPLIGGAAMFIGFCMGFLIFIGVSNPELMAVMFGALMVLAIGFVDDWFKTKKLEFSVMPRAIIQIAAASIVFFADIRFTGFMNPITETYILLPEWLQFVLTITWIFGVMTVINFMDGLDGLAGGLCTITGITLFIVALYMGQPDSAILTILLIGSIIGFLRYNIFPAKVFMGDSGAYFLGFMLAVISLHGAFKQATVVSVFIPILALGVPIFDNVFVVIKRFITHKPVYQADATQIHHRLLRSGLKPSQVVVFLFLISVCLNLTSIIIMLLQKV